MSVDRVVELRQAFDGAFAATRDPVVEAKEDLLAIRAGGDGYGLPLVGIAGIFTGRQVTPLPGAAAALLGIAGFRGTLVPVYDLAQILGYAAEAAPRWLVLAASDPPVALAIGSLDGHLRLPRSAFAACTGVEARPVREVARTGDGALPVIHLPSLLDTITARSGLAGAPARNPQP